MSYNLNRLLSWISIRHPNPDDEDDDIIDLGHLTDAQAHEYFAELQRYGTRKGAEPQRYRLPDGRVVGFFPERRVFVLDPRNPKQPDEPQQG